MLEFFFFFFKSNLLLLEQAVKQATEAGFSGSPQFQTFMLTLTVRLSNAPKCNYLKKKFTPQLNSREGGHFRLLITEYDLIL